MRHRKPDIVGLAAQRFMPGERAPNFFAFFAGFDRPSDVLCLDGAHRLLSQRMGLAGRQMRPHRIAADLDVIASLEFFIVR